MDAHKQEMIKMKEQLVTKREFWSFKTDVERIIAEMERRQDASLSEIEKSLARNIQGKDNIFVGLKEF
jgi:hypothetical protein